MNLRQQVVSGLYWKGGARLVAQATTWIITIVVIRLLKPEDYGLMAMTTTFTGLCMLLAEAGLGSALIQAKAISDDDERRIFGAAIIVHVLLFLGLIGAAPWIAGFFAEERLTLIMRVQSVQLLLSLFIVLPTAIQTRQLNFKHQSIIGTLGAVFASVTTLLLALRGYGVWALVFGNLLGIGLVALGMNLVSPFLKWPNFAFLSSRALLAFSGQVTAARVIYRLYIQADILIAGKLLGKELLGFYAVAMTLAMLPISRLSSMMNQVAFPAFSRAQDEPSLVAPYLLKGLRMQCLVVFPLLWGISSVSPEIVTVFLGHGWQGAALPLQLLALVMPLNALSYFFNAAFQGLGHARVVLSNVLTACLIMPVSFLIGAVWGINGLALAWVVAFPLVVILNLRRMLPLVNITFRRVGAAIGPAAGAAGVMYITVIVARNLSDGANPLVQLVALVATGIASYSFMTWKLNRAAAIEFAEVMRLPLLRRS